MIVERRYQPADRIQHAPQVENDQAEKRGLGGDDKSPVWQRRPAETEQVVLEKEDVRCGEEHDREQAQVKQVTGKNLDPDLRSDFSMRQEAAEYRSQRAPAGGAARYRQVEFAPRKRDRP